MKTKGRYALMKMERPAESSNVSLKKSFGVIGMEVTGDLSKSCFFCGRMRKKDRSEQGEE